MDFSDLLKGIAEAIRDFSDDLGDKTGEDSDKIFDMVLNVLFPDKDED